MKKRKSYDDEFRASAVLMLQAAGYPERLGAMLQVAMALNVPTRTLRRWYCGEQNPPPSKMLRTVTVDFRKVLRAEIEVVLGAMPETYEQASCRDLGIALGMLVEKLWLLDNNSTDQQQFEIAELPVSA